MPQEEGLYKRHWVIYITSPQNENMAESQVEGLALSLGAELLPVNIS